MKRKTLTLSVAAYNVEKTLGKTLESLNDSDLLDALEVFVIDDGSTDATGEVAAMYTRLAPGTFHYIKKANGGHGSTINTSIRMATGQYFRVLDGDDWFDTKAAIQLVHYLEKTDADMVVTNYARVYENTGQQKYVRYENVKYGHTHHFEDICGDHYYMMLQTCIKTDLLQQHNFQVDEGKYYVDTQYSIYPCIWVDTVEFLDLPLYMYRFGHSSQSVAVKGFQKNVKDHEAITLGLAAFYCKNQDACTPKKRQYIARLAQKRIGTQYLIYLSFAFREKQRKQELIAFEHNLSAYAQCLSEAYPPRIWVSLLRRSRFFLWFPMGCAVKARNWLRQARQ